MSTAAEKLVTRTVGSRPLAIGIAVLLVTAGLLAVLGRFIPIAPLLRGWLVAFAIFGSIPIGSMIWLLIHRLTGGEWGIAAAPVLRPAAAMSPLLIVAFVPVLVGLHQIYPWAADPTAIPADVAHWYLNGPSFLLRSLIALVGWSFLAVMFAAGLGSRLLAGLGLAFFGLTISLVAVDWYLSLEPHYVATAFAAMIAIQQLLMALAVAALIGPPAIEGKVAGDLGAPPDRDAAWRRLSRIHDLRGRLVWRPARKGGVVSEAGQFGLDFGFDHGACGGRGAAVRDAADAADPP